MSSLTVCGHRESAKKEQGRGVNLRIRGPFSVGSLISEMFMLPIKDENLCTKHFAVLNSPSLERPGSGLEPSLCFLKQDWGSALEPRAPHLSHVA